MPFVNSKFRCPLQIENELWWKFPVQILTNIRYYFAISNGQRLSIELGGMNFEMANGLMKAYGMSKCMVCPVNGVSGENEYDYLTKYEIDPGHWKSIRKIDKSFQNANFDGRLL